MAHAALPHNAPRLTPAAYFARAREFRAWLEEHDRYLDEMSSTDARRYFARFARRWNDARLPDAYYAGQAAPMHTTRHRWVFAKHATPPGPSTPPRYASAAERQYAREAAQDAARSAAQHARRAARREAREWADEHAPRATGREALQERRREKAASHRAMAERREVDDDVGDTMSTDALLGTGDSFQEALAARDRAAHRRQTRHAERVADRQAERQERMAALQSKEAATMAMLSEMAQRFG